MDPRSEDCVDTVRDWLRRCSTAHENCRLKKLPTLPQRVLDLGSDLSGRTLRLYETRRETAQYVALSHCWGGYQSCKTETTNIEQRQKCITLEELPQNFKDAVFLTSKLGVRYLWIDSLCIVQDDKQDWEVQAAQMTSIYRDSYLTIAAAVAPNSAHGFLIPRSDAERYRGIIPKDRDGKGLPFPLNHVRVRRCLHDRRQRWSGAGKLDPLDSRLWCLQERLMPLRVLSYRQQEMTWECKEAQGCECYGLDEDEFNYEVKTWERELYHELISKASGNKKSDPSICDSIFRWWIGGLETVTSRSLTYESDRLAAISGVAASVHAATGSEYLAGIWKNDIYNGLRWQVRPTNLAKKTVETSVPPVPRAPSWSWSSINAVIMPPGGRDNRTPRITIVDVRCTPESSNNPFGWTRDGYIELLGYLLTGKISRAGPDKDYPTLTMLHLTDLPSQFSNLDIDVSEFRSDTVLVETSTAQHETGFSDAKTLTRSSLSWENGPKLDCAVQCLLLNTVNGKPLKDRSDLIILAPSPKDPGAYERVGFVQARMKSPFQNTETMKVEGLEPTRLKIV